MLGLLLYVLISLYVLIILRSNARLPCTDTVSL